MAWQTNQGDEYANNSTVTVGEPTKASIANQWSENSRFLRDTRLGYIPANCKDGGGYAVSNESGFAFEVVGYCAPNVHEILVDKTAFGLSHSGFMGMDMRNRLITIIGRVYDDVSGSSIQSENEAREYMPGGSYCGTLLQSSGILAKRFWSKAGYDNASENVGNDNHVTYPADYGGDDHLVFAASSDFDGAGQGSEGDLV